jgi:hypothetical protein
MNRFQIGAYCHDLERIDPIGIDRLTYLKVQPSESAGLEVSVGVKSSKEGKKWQNVVSHITLLGSEHMHVEKECQALQAMGFIVRVALPPNVFITGLDVEIDLMAYDFCETDRATFHSPLPAIQQALAFLHDHGVSLKRVHLGLTKKGKLYKNVLPGMTMGYGQRGELGKAIDVELYLENNPAAKIYYTSFRGIFQSFIYHVETGEWISYDDSRTLQSKIEWARHCGLSGVFFN